MCIRDSPGMARIMVKDVTLPEARTIRQRISRVDGVDLVVGPDLAANVYSTDAFIKNSLTDRFYKDGNAVYQIIFEDGDSDASTHKAINEIYGICLLYTSRRYWNPCPMSSKANSTQPRSTRRKA